MRNMSDMIRKKMPVWYSCVGDDATKYMVSISRGMPDDTSAVEIALDYYENHGGDKSAWPITFAVYAKEDGPELCRYVVEANWVPVFTAWEVMEHR